MQKLEKIRPNKSSELKAPVISPRECCAWRRSSANSSPAPPGSAARDHAQGSARMAQRFQVSPASAEAAFRGLLVTHASLEVLAQQLQAFTRRLSAQADGHVPVIADIQGNRLPGQVSLVANQGDFRRIRTDLENSGHKAKGSFASGAVASTTSNTRSASPMALSARSTPIFPPGPRCRANRPYPPRAAACRQCGYVRGGCPGWCRRSR